MEYVDASKFLLKLKYIKGQLQVTGAEQITGIAQMIFDKTKANLKGPGAGVRTSRGGLQYPKTPPKHPLQLPVRRVTGTLARSLKMTPISNYEYIIWCDPQIAPYAKYVHSGTKYVKPRRFLGNVVKGNKAAAVKQLDTILMTMMRNA